MILEDLEVCVNGKAWICHEMTIDEISKLKSFVSGVYIFIDKKRRPLYVGKSTNIRRRLKAHIRTSYMVKYSKSVAIVPGAIANEKEFLQFFRPVGNRGYSDFFSCQDDGRRFARSLWGACEKDVDDRFGTDIR
jgi:hypothetical protein